MLCSVVFNSIHNLTLNYVIIIRKKRENVFCSKERRENGTASLMIILPCSLRKVKAFNIVIHFLEAHEMLISLSLAG